MEFRKQLLGGHFALIVVTMVAAAMAIVALQLTANRSRDAFRQHHEDVVSIERVRRETRQLVDATRRYLSAPDAAQRAQLAELQRALDPKLDRLASRATWLRMLRGPQLEQDADTFIAWLSRAAAEPMTMDAFEKEVAWRRVVMESHFDELASASASHGEETVDDASSLARRAQIGLGLAMLLGAVMSLGLATRLLRTHAAQLRRLRNATNLANQTAVKHEKALEVVRRELRAPLDAIALSASLLRDRTRRESEREHVDRISAAVERAEHLLDDLDDASRLMSGQIELRYERCNTRSLMEACIDRFFARAKAVHVRLKTDCRDILSVRADRERLLQILANLIGNALELAGPGGMVTLSAAPQAPGIRFAVTDTGPGIRPEDRERIFDHDWQGPEHRQGLGLGLGLFISKRLVEAHHGEIGVDSVVGQGSTVWFVIPD